DEVEAGAAQGVDEAGLDVGQRDGSDQDFRHEVVPVRVRGVRYPYYEARTDQPGSFGSAVPAVFSPGGAAANSPGCQPREPGRAPVPQPRRGDREARPGRLPGLTPREPAAAPPGLKTSGAGEWRCFAEASLNGWWMVCVVCRNNKPAGAERWSRPTAGYLRVGNPEPIGSPNRDWETIRPGRRNSAGHDLHR